MGKTKIEWTDCSWNPIVGCSEISPGCANCYAARLAATRLRETPAYKNLATAERRGHLGERDAIRWNGQVQFLPERLEEPLHWRKPRRIFVCDMGDLFHESVSDADISVVFHTIAECPQHTFQILTKRAERMRSWISGQWDHNPTDKYFVPWENVWLGVSVENQHFADERIPLLLDTPAAVRWISFEPLLGPVDLLNVKDEKGFQTDRYDALRGKYAVTCEKLPHEMPMGNVPKLDWVVCGGESGPNARPMHPDWARSLRDQCQAASVPFFMKQIDKKQPIPPDLLIREWPNVKR